MLGEAFQRVELPIEATFNLVKDSPNSRDHEWSLYSVTILPHAESVSPQLGHEHGPHPTKPEMPEGIRLNCSTSRVVSVISL
jgi:hypothetical protein